MAFWPRFKVSWLQVVRVAWPFGQGFFPRSAVPYSLFPIPCSLFPIPCSLLPAPCSLKPKTKVP
ncbi:MULTISPECIES: hypothetical protein [unclassified Moorena]|uniref:hypothetical protein n=1 Tax=unclassified Moorena TaxID=2683338 RepID=UPI0013FFE2A8|nr:MULTISPECIES: hypothetical protein [unclassified Moorena]NEO12842.1 hypothetical protein [Moorena sp. SIO3E8]NEQ01644.1 hypothetical protein [Moorena sp. SIO3F7]NEQ62291.1 hypothetical protein [Moorena sp. SIO4A1]